MAKAVRPEPSSMEEMWRAATIKFNERTGLNVDLKPPKTLNNCIGELEESRYPDESEEKSGKEKLEDYGINIIRCLKLLGGIAAQGVEVVFGAPSSICFNALFLLLDIPEHLRSFREAVEGLFETLAPCLSVFRIYEKMDQFNEIEPELKQAIHEVMICFVDICALSIQLRDSGKWRKFKSRMKHILIQDDSGIKAELEKFERLTKSHYSIQATQTLKVVLDTRGDLTEYFDRESEKSQQIANDVASLKAADDKRNSEDSKRKYIENIKKKLGIDDSVYKTSKERCDKPRKDSVPNTASWFMDHPDFLRWTERDDKESDKLFILTGAPNTGKSVILSAMVHYLRSTYESPARHSPRTLIAAHFFPNTMAKDDQDKRPIATALKCIAIQLVDQDSLYAKSLSQACDSKSDNTNFFRDASCQELWDFLRIGSPRGNLTHYIVLDGLGGLPEESSDNREQKEQLLSIICSSAQPSVRVLLSARQDMFRNKELLPSHFNLEIDQHNEPDIQKYVENYLRSSDIFQDPEDKPLRTKVLDTLAKQVHGNFNKAKAALENIREVVASDGLESDIDRILDESNMNEKQITQTVISQLEEKLTGDEIDELNELLIWVICGKVFFDVDDLNAALVLRSRRRGTLRLKKKLEGKYSNILTIRRDDAVVVTDDMDDVLTTRRTKPRSVDDTPTFTATITITKGDLRSVQSFLWSLSQKVDSLAHDTFGFEQISDQKGVKNNIQVNEVDAHLTIVRRTFSMLASEPTKESELLGVYLVDFLPQHLKELLEKATGYDELTPPQKQEIGEGLFSLFVSGEAVERHWHSCRNVIWFREPDEVETFRKWLEDPIATSRLGRLDREWLKKVQANPNPNQALLENIMRTVAWHWLCDREWDAVKAFQWLKGFLRMPAPRRETQNQVEDDGSDDGNSIGSHIVDDRTSVEEVAEWCKGVHTITSDEAKALMNERLGETYLGEVESMKAIEAYGNSMSLVNPGWKCLEGLSRALAENGQYGKACEEMEKALQLLSDGDNPEKDLLLSESYSRLAEWQIVLRQPRRAVEYAKQAMELAPEDHKPQYELLRIYLENDFTNDAANLLDVLVKAGNQQDGVSRFGRILADMLTANKPELTFGRCFMVLSKDPDTFTGVLRQMDLAIDHARENYGVTNNVTMLYLYKGIALYRYGAEEDRIQQALRCWEQCLGLEMFNGIWNYAQIEASTWISGHYFDQAKALGESSSPDIETYIKRMSDIATRSPSLFNLGPKTCLASYYARFTKDALKARGILQAYIDSAFGLLSDDISDNDGDGYYQLGEALLYCGDELDALSAFSLPLPTFTSSVKGDVISWILKSDTEQERLLGDKLRATIEEISPGGSLEDQIEVTRSRIDGILHDIDNKLTASQEINADGDGIDGIPIPQITTNSSEVEMKATYERIRSRISQWLNAFRSGARRWCDVCDTMWDLEHANIATT